jgi:hypothetical protein
VTGRLAKNNRAGRKNRHGSNPGNKNSVGNALRGVPLRMWQYIRRSNDMPNSERHGVRSLQGKRRIVTLTVDELNHAEKSKWQRFCVQL